ncbi:hypothetical protein M422DRAFT_35657 [Sphaerobolus stellatus SS14]|uniref:Uncharacterized protein n=1 Tax=Sphaerobolus stellatus (strain SS14) TaxID=990650 RepID=A0A0C9V6G4_SPHS4|nr:hypothetical protein M422DRAFT_35657 [Sphaerobolus stellatus SS14]
MSRRNGRIKTGTGNCKKGFEVQWTTVTAEEARGDHLEVSATRAAAKPPSKSLDLTPKQHS